MKASEIMTSPPITVEAGTPVEDAAGLLARHNINTLPVTDPDGRLLAVVTETDVFHALALRLGIGLSPTARLDQCSVPRRVSDIAQRVSATVRGADEVSYCLAVMARNGGRSLPVLDAGRVVGIISRREALRALTAIDAATLRDLITAGRLPEPQAVSGR